MTRTKREPLPERIRTFDEAMRLLDLDLEASGIPSSEIRASVVDAPESPTTLAEFAASIVLTRRGGRLAERKPGDRIRRTGAVNLWFVAWGSIVRARDGGLIMGSLSLAARQDDEAAGSDVALGITAEILRVVRPAHILSEALSYLRRTGDWLEAIERGGGPAAPAVQKRALNRVRETRLRTARVPDEDIAALAARYVTLYRRGARRPTAQLAKEFGITTTQVRDRIHRARHELGYLTPGKQGRAGAEPTKRLLEIWSPGKPARKQPKPRRRSRKSKQQRGDEDV